MLLDTVELRRWAGVLIGVVAVRAAPLGPIGHPVELLAVPFALSSVELPVGSLFETVRARNLVRS
jgi:hypothetical protein